MDTARKGASAIPGRSLLAILLGEGYAVSYREKTGVTFVTA